MINIKILKYIEFNRINIKNNNCHITIDNNDKSISGTNVTDQYNLPSFYTRNKRSFKKASEEIQKVFDENTEMLDVIDICDKYNLNTHSYCAMD